MNIYKNPSTNQWSEIMERPTVATGEMATTVKAVFEKVKKEGDKALNWYTNFFDKVEIKEFTVEKSVLNEAKKSVSQELKNAIELAKANIETFHASQKLEKKVITTSDGIECWQESRPIEKVGIYIPGGTAPLFSTVLMLAIPAKLAGCKEIVLCSPPDKDGNINPVILFTANLLGIEKVYRIGGIQAIAALTYGTASIPKVYKIFGPGNQYVTAAKQYALNEGVSIDMPAGPSELLVVADETANPEFVASDLLSQAEHGADSQVICVSNSADFLFKVEDEVAKQIEVLPRKEVAQKTIENSKLVFFEDKQAQIDFINQYAPEHFIIACEDENFYVQNIVSAGSVFIGNYTPESAGDYASGTNHTLPTNGFAKAYSGVNMDSFTKKITFQKITKEGIQKIGNAIEIMAEAEGLQAHKNAVTLRLNS